MPSQSRSGQSNQGSLQPTRMPGVRCVLHPTLMRKALQASDWESVMHLQKYLRASDVVHCYGIGVRHETHLDTSLHVPTACLQNKCTAMFQ